MENKGLMDVIVKICEKANDDSWYIGEVRHDENMYQGIFHCEHVFADLNIYLKEDTLKISVVVPFWVDITEEGARLELYDLNETVSTKLQVIFSHPVLVTENYFTADSLERITEKSLHTILVQLMMVALNLKMIAAHFPEEALPENYCLCDYYLRQEELEVY